MAIIQSIPISGSGSTYTNMTTDEAIAGTNTEERVISAKVLNDAIDNKIPTIPTVNNATLTIQKNGTTVKTFTANSSSNVTCNITVPTKVSQLTNDSGFIVDVSGKADKATTLSGYGITDAYTKTQVDKKVSDLVNSAPETLDTLNELASALGNDPNFATTVATQIGTKANDSNVVHKSGDEDINGTKTFKSIVLKSSKIERGVLPAANIIEDREIEIVDKNNKRILGIFNYYYTNSSGRTAFYAYNPNTTDYDNIAVSFDFDNTNSQKSFVPNVNDDYNLGTPTLKWKDVYATAFHGNLVGNANTATNATNNASGNELSNDIIKGLSVSGKTITYTKLDGTTGTITTQDTNTWTAFKGATTSANGAAGYVPAPTKGNQNKFFKADGTWATPTDTTYSVATTSKNGLMSSTDKTKLDGLSNYTLPTAGSELGGVKTTSTVTSTSGLTACPIISGVPYYKDTNTTYSNMSAAEATTGTATTARTITAKVLNDKIDEKIGNFETKSNAITGLSVSGKVITYTKGDGSTGTITTQDTNTDTKVTNTLGNTTKAYITGTTSAKTNTGTQIFDSGVYLTTTAGQLHADIDFPITEAQVNEILGIA